jgi:hypothetical protein
VKKGKKGKNYKKIIEFAAKKGEHEKHLQQVARERANKLKMAMDEAVSE